MLWNQWSSEEEKSKLGNRGKGAGNKERGKKTYPEATGLCFLGKGTPIFCLFIFSTGSG
jgi:hypothetical protein